MKNHPSHWQELLPIALTRFAVLTGLMFAAVVPLPAQEPETEAQLPEAQLPEAQFPEAQFPEAQFPEAQFVETVDVEIVNVDVWVTDRDGNSVNGLSRNDFEVLRDGEAIEITNFYAVAGGRPVEAPAAPESSDASDAPPARPRIEPSLRVDQQLWLIVYVDNFNLDPIERNRVIPALEAFLYRTLNQGGKAMIVTYDRFLEVRQPFSDNPTAVADALIGLRKTSGLATVRRREQMQTLRTIDKAEDVALAIGYAHQYAESVRSEIDFTVDALDRLVDTLAGLPGRKALVYVSSGVPMAAGEEMFHVIGEKFDSSEAYSSIPRHDTSRRFEAVSRRANAHRVVFHTVDAGGLRGIEFGAAEYGGFVTPNIRSTLDSVVPENLQAPLRLIAEETGGRSILNQNDITPALTRVQQDLASFYSLGIQSTDVDSGRYHRLEVRLKERQRGVRIRHRAGYRSKSKNTRLEETLRSALLYEHEDNPMGVGFAWGAAQPHGDEGLYVLPIQVRVPLKETVLLPMADGKHEARLRLYVGVADDQGDLSELDDVPFGVRLDPENVEAALGESLVYTHRLLVNPGRQKVGIAVSDVFGNRASVLSAATRVGPAPSDL